jgi:hypothetical protein
MSVFHLQQAHRKKAEHEQGKEKKPCERKKSRLTNQIEFRLNDFRIQKKLCYFIIGDLMMRKIILIRIKTSFLLYSV